MPTKPLQLNPRLPEALQRRAVAHAMKGDLANAKKDLDEALTINPNHVDALCDRAYLYGMVGDLPKAMADIELAVQANPLSARAHFQKGLALLEQKNVDQAVVSFDEAIRLQEKHAGAHCFRGYARIEKDEFEKAKEDFDKAISLDPKLAKAYSGRSKVLKILGLHKEASADTAKFKELTPDPKKPEKKEKEKEKDKEPENFVVKSKPVSPEKRTQMLRSAKEIDKLVQENYARHGAPVNEKTTDSQFLRRVYLDITGTIPTYNQTRKIPQLYRSQQANIAD